MSTATEEKIDGKKLAGDIHAFVESDLGTHYLKQLSLQYNAWHQEAESPDLGFSQKAMKVERAAGLRWAIDYLMTRDKHFREGYWDEPEAKPAD